MAARHWHRVILAAAGICTAGIALAGPADRLLRACAPGLAGDPAQALRDEGWIELGPDYAPLIALRLGLFQDASFSVLSKTDLARLSSDLEARRARGQTTYEKNQTDESLYFTPGDSVSMAQISRVSGPNPLLYCMITTSGNAEAYAIAARLNALADPDKAETFEGIYRGGNQTPPAPDPTPDVSATPLPEVWQVIQIDAQRYGDIIDADLSIEGFWSAQE